jgi:prepilin-type N-terminal cleavage/methylation domain-containing protein
VKKGFTLIEMLVVIGIIAVLAGASIGVFAKASKKAQLAKGRELVSNVATALATIYQQSGRWPEALVDANGQNDWKLGEAAALVLARKGVLSLSYKNVNGVYTLTGPDRFGIVDPWAYAVLKRDESFGKSAPVPSGKTVDDHFLRFAIDVDGRGFTEATVCGKKISVRAPAIVWSTGPDGRFDDFDKAGRSDDIFSFRIGQVKQGGE